MQAMPPGEMLVGQTIENKQLKARIHSLNIVPTFPLGRVAGTAALGGLEIPHGQKQSMIFLLLHTKTGPSKVGDTVMPLDAWTRVVNGLHFEVRTQPELDINFLSPI